MGVLWLRRGSHSCRFNCNRGASRKKNTIENTKTSKGALIRRRGTTSKHFLSNVLLGWHPREN